MGSRPIQGLIADKGYLKSAPSSENGFQSNLLRLTDSPVVDSRTFVLNNPLRDHGQSRLAAPEEKGSRKMLEEVEIIGDYEK